MSLPIALSLDLADDKEHSQMVRTHHPSRRSRLVFRWSRSLLRLNFSFQNRLFCLGIRPFWHECACQ